MPQGTPAWSGRGREPVGERISDRESTGGVGGPGGATGTPWLARNRPDEPVEAERFGPGALALLSAQHETPRGGWTHRTVLIAVARRAGFWPANTMDRLDGKRSGAGGVN